MVVYTLRRPGGFFGLGFLGGFGFGFFFGWLGLVFFCLVCWVFFNNNERSLKKNSENFSKKRSYV